MTHRHPSTGEDGTACVGLLTGLSEGERSRFRNEPESLLSTAERQEGTFGGRPDLRQERVPGASSASEGESYRSIREQTGLALATITRIVKEVSGRMSPRTARRKGYPRSQICLG